MRSTIQRTHRLGRPVAARDRETPIEGVVRLASIERPDMGRSVDYLSIDRHADSRPTFPHLWDPHWLTFGSDGGCVVRGFEEVDGRRYYQGWYIQWG